MVVAGDADLAIATEAIADYDTLLMLPWYQWNRCIVAPLGHPILDAPTLTLEQLALRPMCMPSSKDSRHISRARL